MNINSNKEKKMERHVPQTGERYTNGGRLVSYEVKCSAGLGRLGWPTGFSGGGWALLDITGEFVLTRHAFRVEALKALALEMGLITTGCDVDAVLEELAADLNAKEVVDA